MKSRKFRRHASSESSLGFQIAPMIDVVFVILLFFMVAAGDARLEKTHTTQLPGPSTELTMPDEVLIEIDADGQVYLNDEPLDGPEGKNLVELAAEMKSLKQVSDRLSADLLVTIQAAQDAKYERVVDVLDALTRAKIKGVTFVSVDE